MPVSAGMDLNNAMNASRPPADAPTPTIGNALSSSGGGLSLENARARGPRPFVGPTGCELSGFLRATRRSFQVIRRYTGVHPDEQIVAFRADAGQIQDDSDLDRIFEHLRDQYACAAAAHR